MSKKKGTGINVGSVSILVIFVLLCLITFATLSLVSAKADAKLTDTAANSLSDFYTADSKAEEVLASIDSCLKSTAIVKNKQEYFNNCITSLSKLDMVSTISSKDNLTLSYTVGIDDKKELQVSLDVLYPIDNRGERFKLLKWQTVHIGEEEADDSLSLWNSDEPMTITK